MTHMKLTSEAFGDGAVLPDRFVGTAGNLSPPLRWESAPPGAQSFALFCHDPDAPLIQAPAYGFVHWVYYNIPSDVSELQAGSEQYTLGRNDYIRRQYDGPRPPEGHGKHRYYFWLLALDTNSEFEPGLSLWDFLTRIENNVLGMSRIVASYER